MLESEKTYKVLSVVRLPIMAAAAVLGVTTAAAQSPPSEGTLAVQVAGSGDEAHRSGSGLAAVQFPGSNGSVEDDPQHLRRVRRITLQQVQQSADPHVANLSARMAQLAVEAAKQHRLAVQADYFPKFGALAGNVHYTDFLGNLVTLRRPIVGTPLQVSVPIFSQNQDLCCPDLHSAAYSLAAGPSGSEDSPRR